MKARKYVYFDDSIGNDAKEKSTELERNSMFECDQDFLESCIYQRYNNISLTAFTTFTKLIQSLGPVLTCKYFCVDLLKMLAVFYMNSKCLRLIEGPGTFFFIEVLLYKIKILKYSMISFIVFYNFFQVRIKKILFPDFEEILNK